MKTGRLIRSASSLLLLLAAQIALAQDPAEAQAKQHFKEAQAAYNLGQFAKALESYSAAYAAKPLPPFLFNIAQCHRQLGNWERAAFFYKRFLSMGAPGADQAKVEELAKQMDEKQAAAEAKRREDEEAARRAKEAAEMKAHTLELERAREATAKAEAEAAAQRAAEAAAAAKLKESAPPEVPLYQKWWLWAGIGVVVAGAAAATSVAVVTRPQPEAPSYGTVNAR